MNFSKKAATHNQTRRLRIENVEQRKLMAADAAFALESAPQSQAAASIAPAVMDGAISNVQRLVARTAVGNDTMSGATVIGTVNSTVSYTGSVGGSDTADFYKFRVNEGGQTTISLAGLRSDIDMQILDSSGRVLASSTRGGSNSESATVNLSAGQDYFVKLYPYAGASNSSYSLSITPPRANNSMSAATSLGDIFNTSRTITSNTGSSDSGDYFSFTPGPVPAFSLWAGTRTVNIQLTGLSTDLDVQILDASGRVVAQGARGGSSSESVSVSLTNGSRYFVRVFSYSGAASNYNLTINTRV